MKRVTFVVGPTASGKTAYSIELAKKTDAEIISADSMQIYKYMDIGTAKPSEIERDGILHHMIDIIYPDQNFSVALYQKMALEKIKEISTKGKRVIVTGGTGLYINSLVYNISYAKNSMNEQIRSELEYLASARGNEYIHNMLKELDPVAAQRIHVNDKKRVIRALEIYQTTGKNTTEQIDRSRDSPPGFEYVIIGLEVDRQELRRRIDERVDKMMNAGLQAEVKSLLEMGYGGGTAMQAIGYKELVEHFNCNISLDEAVEKIKTGTKQYAKRQITWFRKISNIKWFN
jgi:tRNA dimethylallyltransferase